MDQIHHLLSELDETLLGFSNAHSWVTFPGLLMRYFWDEAGASVLGSLAL